MLEDVEDDGWTTSRTTWWRTSTTRLDDVDRRAGGRLVDELVLDDEVLDDVLLDELVLDEVLDDVLPDELVLDEVLEDVLLDVLVLDDVLLDEVVLEDVEVVVVGAGGR